MPPHRAASAHISLCFLASRLHLATNVGDDAPPCPAPRRGARPPRPPLRPTTPLCRIAGRHHVQALLLGADVCPRARRHRAG
eukprot:2785497-Prymnesium_polylepis.1